MVTEAEQLLTDGPGDAATTLILAHGAGAPMDSPFLESFARELARDGLRVVRFEFPYMRRRRLEGGRRPPDCEPVLRRGWAEVVERLRPAGRLFIGGKSMGGRIASLVADELGVAGLICLGYPFHPTGNPDRLRVAHLAELRTPTLILQGTRDPFGRPEEIAGYRLSAAIHVQYLEDGDHSFRPRRASGRTEAENVTEAVRAVLEFLDPVNGVTSSGGSAP